MLVNGSRAAVSSSKRSNITLIAAIAFWCACVAARRRLDVHSGFRASAAELVRAWIRFVSSFTSLKKGH
jgi:hypothetical protein